MGGRRQGGIQGSPTQLIASPRAFLTDYASDVATGQDELGIYADVRSIAELICLREAPPPLSVGLFGNWGSGKSFFMHLLQQEVDRLSQEAKAPRPNGKGPSPFVGNVVQIQFNAWPYADANLWASLTAEFFDQLRVGGFRGSGAATHAALIRQVGEHIKSLESDTARIEHDAQALEQKARSLADAVARSEQALARTEVELIGRHVGQEVGKLLEDNKDQIDEIGARLYGAQNFAGTARFTAAVAELKETSAKLALIGQALVAGGWPTWTAGAGVLALAVFVLVRTTDPSAVLQVANKLAVQTASLSASLAALLTALWGAYRFVRPMLDGAAAFARDLAEEKKRRADRLAQAQDELATLQAEVENAREKADSARRKLSPYRDFDKGRAHGTILKYFLFEDAETKEYEKHIGLVSRARRTFQKLDEIIRAQRLKPAGRQELAVPDRIILYIDDLDRCRNEQVVRVLEAVHLLLAFESIVVVVGVDARWIRAALAKYYQGEFAAAQAAPADWARDSQTATPEDYLEKIFQIPFWLQPFARDPTRSYAGFINALTRKTEGGPGAGGGAGTKTAGAAGKSQGAGIAQTTAASVAAAASANERLALSEGEVAVLAALAPMAGDTPRAIKRFVNLYRLIRARQRGADFDRFVGRSGARATYPAVAFLLAFETGQPPRMIELMHDIVAVGQGKLTAALRDAIAAAEKAIGEAALSEPDVRPASAPAGPAMQPADADGVSRRPAPLQSRLALLRSVEAELARVAKSASDAVQAIAEIGRPTFATSFRRSAATPSTTMTDGWRRAAAV